MTCFHSLTHVASHRGMRLYIIIVAIVRPSMRYDKSFSSQKITNVIFVLVAGLFLFISCTYENNKNRYVSKVEATIVIEAEKYLTHYSVDAVATYSYEAEYSGENAAEGETNGETLLLLNENGTGSIGYLEPGLWTFTVRAYNSKGTLLYIGRRVTNVSRDNNIVNVVLALQKEGEGTATFTITSRCTGDSSSLFVLYQSYDGTVGGQSEEFSCTCDGLTDTWKGTITLPENRYKLTVRLATDTTYLASDITDVLILNGEDILITGVLDGQENQSVTIKPEEPVIPKGYISLDGHVSALAEVSAKWNYTTDAEKPTKVEWYLDGTLIGNGLTLKVTLPSSGMHNITATAALNGEYASDSYKLNISSGPMKLVGGTICADRGAVYGTYWIDDYEEYYRKTSGEEDSYRYLVCNLFTETGADTYTYTEALALESTLETLGKKGYRIPTKDDAALLVTAQIKGLITLPSAFWTSTSYNSSYAYAGKDGKVSAVSKTTKARIILVRDI